MFALTVTDPKQMTRERHQGKNVRLEMAYVNSSRTAPVSFSDRFAALAKVVKTMVERRKLYNQTLYELQALSDRDLSDLGMSRSSIADVAYAAAYKS